MDGCRACSWPFPPRRREDTKVTKLEMARLSPRHKDWRLCELCVFVPSWWKRGWPNIGRAGPPYAFVTVIVKAQWCGFDPTPTLPRWVRFRIARQIQSSNSGRVRRWPVTSADGGWAEGGGCGPIGVGVVSGSESTVEGGGEATAEPQIPKDHCGTQPQSGEICGQHRNSRCPFRRCSGPAASVAKKLPFVVFVLLPVKTVFF